MSADIIDGDRKKKELITDKEPVATWQTLELLFLFIF